ncbi:MAG: ribonuclease HII [Ruminococcus sp.]
MEKDWLKYEKEALSLGYTNICGVDEAGRGPLAGPVCAAAVILPRNHIIEGVNDSKKLSEKKREMLFDVIKNQSLSYSIAFATVEEIENLNILEATMLAMQRAVKGLNITPDFVMVDGNKCPEIDIKCESIVKGDANSMSIAAASILAKVSRDRLCYEYAEQYPQYLFDKHKGYGTKLHIEMIKKYGPCPIHRKSFLKKILSK